MQAGEVTATGMKVSVESTGGLIISYAGANDAWGTTATANMQNAKRLKPASTADFSSWSTAKALSAANYAFNKETIDPVTSTVVGNDGKVISETDYAIRKSFKIRATNAECTRLYVKSVAVTVGDTEVATAQNLSSALRVGIKWYYTPSGTNTEQTGSFIMAPVDPDGDAAPTLSYKYYATSTTSDDEAVQVTARIPGTNTDILGTGVPVPTSDGSAVLVDIIIWYEGQDGQLFSDNIEVDESLKVSVTFSTDMAPKT